jgi:hypothetical protein
MLKQQLEYLSHTLSLLNILRLRHTIYANTVHIIKNNTNSNPAIVDKLFRKKSYEWNRRTYIYFTHI